MKVIRAAIVLFFAAPGVAWASPELVARDLAVRSGASSQAPHQFALVGLHWRGAGAVRFRTRAPGGRWSAWHLAAPESDDLPDRNTAEADRNRGWHLGNPYWVGAATRIQYRLSGRVSRLRAFFVRSPAARRARQQIQPFSTSAPPIITRSQWGANERIRRDRTAHYADDVHLAIVHHTAGSNSYSRAQSAAIVRAIEVYHVLGNGWDDIGYNFLVDKYGQVFEGRWGGIERPVVGAHAMGFNYGSVGVALIGNYNGAGLTTAERASLVKLLAWRLDVSHVDPLSQVSRVSAGNPRYREGAPVVLRAISGHRDAYPTSCPGANVYAELPSIAREVAVTGFPKIYSPIVFGAIGGNVRFTARLSSGARWTVTVDDALGQTVASSSGSGRSVDWTWNASLVPPGRYTYTIAASTGASTARPVIGTIGQTLPQLSVTQLRVRPGIVSPNGDGVGDTAQISYALGATASLTVALGDAAGKTLSTLFSGVVLQGLHSLTWSQVGVPDGRYRITIAAVGANGRQVSNTTVFYVDRTLGAVKVSAPAFSPNGDGTLDATSLSFALAVAAPTRVEVRRAGRRLATLFTGDSPAGPGMVAWDGTIGGKPVRDGKYDLVVTATDRVTTVSQPASVSVDTTPPRLRAVSRRQLRFWTSEPALVTVRIGSMSITKRVRGGYFSVPRLRGIRHFALVATDAAGNKSRPVRA